MTQLCQRCVDVDREATFRALAAELREIAVARRSQATRAAAEADDHDARAEHLELLADAMAAGYRPEDKYRMELPPHHARLAHVAEVTGSVCHCAACTGARRAEAFRGEREHPRSVRGGR